MNDSAKEIAVPKTRVLLVEDDSLLRSGLKSMINTRDDYVVDGDTGTGKEAIQLFKTRQPEIVLLDLRLPDILGTEALKEIKEVDASVPVVILTACDDNEFIYETLESGANAYVLKGSNPEELFLGMHYALLGDLFISPRLAKLIVKDYLFVNRQRTSLPPLENLTPREKEIVQLIIQKKKSKEIAEMLFISVKTVDKHRSNILAKLGIKSCYELRQRGMYLMDDFNQSQPNDS